MNTPEVMSRKEAASILMDMAGGGVSVKECEALHTAVRSLVKRYFDSKKNRARRREKGDE
jgi:hypothetical protein